ncbi:MAG: hypothetical protein RLZ35_546 [Pseudomonadota bacterium]
MTFLGRCFYWLNPIICLCLLLLLPSILLAEPWLVQDTEVKGHRLKNFRTTASIKNSNIVDKQSLSQLNVSGSGQFSPRNIDIILHSIPKTIPRHHIFIVDLRQESHGFLGKIPITWYAGSNNINQGKMNEQIEQEETEALKSLSTEQFIQLYHYKKMGKGKIQPIKSFFIPNPGEVRREQDFVDYLGLKAQRFYVLDGHRPDDKEVDRFVTFVRSLPKNAWLHVHCKAGRGRTTTFMVLYDIIRNGKKLRLEDIIERQIQIGGSPVNQTTLTKADKWKESPAQARYRFIQQFYRYVIDPTGYSAGQSWSGYMVK